MINLKNNFSAPILGNLWISGNPFNVIFKPSLNRVLIKVLLDSTFRLRLISLYGT